MLLLIYVCWLLKEMESARNFGEFEGVYTEEHLEDKHDELTTTPAAVEIDVIDEREKNNSRKKAESLFQEDLEYFEWGDNEEFKEAALNKGLTIKEAIPFEVFENFVARGVEESLLDDAVFNSESAPGIAILNRNSFISWYLETLSQVKNDKNLTILMFDISLLREADRLKDKEGRAYAEIILRKFAHILNDTEKESGRFGGDEFAVALLSDKSKDLMDHEIEQIEAEVIGNARKVNTKIVAKDAEGNIIKDEYEERPLQIKNNAAVRIIVPPDMPKFGDTSGKTYRRLFEMYARRGFLLDNEEIDELYNEVSIEELEQDEEFEAKRKDPKRFKSEHDIQNSIQDLLTVYPEFAYQFSCAEIADGYERLLYKQLGIDDKPVFSRRVKMFTDFENSHMNRLLNKFVYKKGQFLERMNHSAFSKVISMKIPYAKENNDNGNFERTNLMIKSLDKKVDDVLNSIADPEERKKIKSRIAIASEGGVYLLGFRGEIPEDIQKQIESIDEIQPFRDNDIKIPIGKYIREFSKEELGKSKSDLKPFMSKEFDVLLKKADQDFLIKFGTEMGNNIPMYRDLFHQGLENMNFRYDYKTLKYQQVVRSYIMSEKRYSERINELKNFLNTSESESIPNKESIQFLLTYIYRAIKNPNLRMGRK